MTTTANSVYLGRIRGIGIVCCRKLHLWRLPAPSTSSTNRECGGFIFLDLGVLDPSL